MRGWIGRVIEDLWDAIESCVDRLLENARVDVLSSPIPKSRHKVIRFDGKHYNSNGTREVSRRLRQIADGHLTASNGVVFK